MKYIRISMNRISKNDKTFKAPLYLKILSKLFSFFVPKQNPEFENEIGNVNEWLLEFKYNDWNYKNEVEREIGINDAGIAIVKMPYNKNYGFWSDEDVDYDFFIEKFKYEEISKEYFNEMWNSFE